MNATRPAKSLSRSDARRQAARKRAVDTVVTCHRTSPQPAPGLRSLITCDYETWLQLRPFIDAEGYVTIDHQIVRIQPDLGMVVDSDVVEEK